jgi:hypothetical protein
MPWTAKSARRFTKRARTPKRRRQWQHVANSVLRRTGNKARAVRSANAAVKKSAAKKRRKR